MNGWRFTLVPAPPPGGKTQGMVDWGDPVLTGWDWPYIAVRGAQDGPSLLVTAGLHGSEYPSIDAAVRFAAGLDPTTLRGQVLCLPLMNPAAFWQRIAYVSPIDNLNMNRIFPGRPDGSFSERLAHGLVQKAMRHADAFLDLHGGDIPEALVGFSMYEETGDAGLDARSQAMAAAFGSPALLVQRRAESPIAGLAYTMAAELGIPALIAEDGGAGVYDADASTRMLRGAENVLRTLEMSPGDVEPMPPQRRFSHFVWVRSRQAGFFRPSVRVGDAVEAGMTLGTLHDFFGRTVEAIVAPQAGLVLFQVVSAAIAETGLICGIGAGEQP